LVTEVKYYKMSEIEIADSFDTEVKVNDLNCDAFKNKVPWERQIMFSYFCSKSMSKFLLKIQSALNSFVEQNNKIYKCKELTNESEWKEVYLSDMSTKNVSIECRYAKKVRPQFRSLNNLYAVFYILHNLEWDRRALIAFIMKNKGKSNQIREEDINKEIDRLRFKLTKEHIDSMKHQWLTHIGFDEMMCYLKLCETVEIQVISDLFFSNSKLPEKQKFANIIFTEECG
jgi:hypothetical protein